MNCQEFQEKMIDLFDLELVRPECEELQQHFETCGNCLILYNQSKQIIEELSLRHTVKASARFKEKIMESIAKLETASRTGQAARSLFSAWWKPALALALAATVISALWPVDWPGLFQKIAGNDRQRQAFNMLSQAMAAESTLFKTQGVTHLVNATIVTPVEDSVRAAMRSSFFCSLDPSGKILNNLMKFVTKPGEECTVCDEAWYDPDSSRFARVIKAGERVLFANSFDGRFIYTLKPEKDGTLQIVKEKITPDFKAPQNPAAFLGLAVGFKSEIEKEKHPFLSDSGMGTLADGVPVRIIKAQTPPPPGVKVKINSFWLFKIRQDDGTLAESEWIFEGKPFLIHRRELTQTIKDTTGIPWNLENLIPETPQAVKAPRIDLLFDLSVADASAVEMLYEADDEIMVFATDPAGTSKRQTFSMKAGLVPWPFHMIIYQATDSCHIVLSQSPAYSMITVALAKDGKILYTSPDGFKAWTNPQSEWMANISLQSARGFLKEKPVDKPTGIIIESPVGTTMIMSANGTLSESELRSLVDNLVFLEEYVGEGLLNEDMEKVRKDPNGWTAMFAAVSQGMEKKVSGYLQAGMSPETKNPRTDLTVLMAAAARGKTNIARALVKAGANVNARNKAGGTALVFSASGGHFETMEFLSGAGADINAADTSGKTALIAAVERGDMQIIQALLRAGVDVNREFSHGTALVAASAMGLTDVVKTLLAAGAEVNKAGKDGRTALMMAARNAFPGIVDLLVAAGADVNLLDTEKAGALTWAVNRNNIPMIKSLIAAGAKADTVNNWGESVLFKTAAEGTTEALEILLAAGAQVNKKANYGGTPLMAAAGKGNSGNVKALLARGAQVNVSDEKGNTALKLAVEGGHKEAAELLREAGAKR